MSAVPHSSRRASVGPAAYPRAKVSVRKRANPVLGVAHFCMVSLITMAAIHFAGGFAVQLSIEESRRSAISAGHRAERAELEAAELRQRLDELQSTAGVERWAALNGFQSSYLVSR